jgi:hypothetical protein
MQVGLHPRNPAVKVRQTFVMRDDCEMGANGLQIGLHEN